MKEPRAFSLVELVIVLVIIGLISAIVIPRVSRLAEDSGAIVAKRLEQSLASALSIYLLTHKQYPTGFYSWVALTDQAREPDNLIWIGPAIRNQLKDPTANILTNGDRTITLNFKDGFVAVYELLPDGEIDARYTDPDQGSDSGG